MTRTNKGPYGLLNARDELDAARQENSVKLQQVEHLLDNWREMEDAFYDEGPRYAGDSREQLEQDPVYQRLHTMFFQARAAYNAFSGTMVSHEGRGVDALEDYEYMKQVHHGIKDMIDDIEDRGRDGIMDEELYTTILDDYAEAWRAVEEYSDVERVGGSSLIGRMWYDGDGPYDTYNLPEEEAFDPDLRVHRVDGKIVLGHY